MNKISLAVACALSFAAVAQAQDTKQQTKGDDELEEVTVLATRARAATKTDTLLVETPQSISVVTAEQIAERGALNYQDVFRYSAGIDTERFGADTRSDDFSARGFALKQYLDELNKTPRYVYGSRTEVFTLERAEVLRGPSAVLYGAGSSGGLLNAVSKRPKFEAGGELGLQFGNFERKQFQADITGPLSDNVAGRVVGLVRDGELQSPGQKNDKQVVMPSLTWKPGEATDVTLIALYQKEDLGTQTYLPMSKTLQASAENPRIPLDFFVGEPGFNHMKTDQYAFTALVSHRFNDWLSLTSNSRYIDQKTDYGEVYGTFTGADPFDDPERTLLSRAFYILDEDYTTVNTDNHAQLDFQTGPISHKVLVGVDYTLFKQDRQEGFSCRFFFPGCYPTGPAPLNVYNPVYGQPFDYGFTNAYDTRSTLTGLYLQDQMKIGSRVSVVLGARRDRATSEGSATVKDTTDANTFKVGVIAEVFQGFSPFVSYSESFTPIFGGDFYGNAFKPQQGEQYEGGFKWQPLANSLITASYFDIEESNFLTTDVDNIQNFIQSGVIGSTGYEVEAILNFDNGFGVTGNWSYTKAEILEGTVDHPAGDRVEDLPEHLASLWVNKSFIVSTDLAWRVGAGVRRIGDKIDYYQLQETPSVTLVDAMAEVSYKDWNLSVNVNNVADKEFFASCAAWSAPYPDGMCYPGMTRSIVATVSRKFWGRPRG